GPTQTRSALGSMPATLLAGLMSKASTTTGAGELMDVITRQRPGLDALTSPAAALAGDDGVSNLTKLGRPMFSAIFGTPGDRLAGLDVRHQAVIGTVDDEHGPAVSPGPDRETPGRRRLECLEPDEPARRSAEFSAGLALPSRRPPWPRCPGGVRLRLGASCRR